MADETLVVSQDELDAARAALGYSASGLLSSSLINLIERVARHAASARLQGREEAARATRDIDYVARLQLLLDALTTLRDTGKVPALMIEAAEDDGLIAALSPSRVVDDVEGRPEITEAFATIDDAGMRAYIDQLGTPETLEQAIAARNAWVESAAQFSRNEEYYRGLVDEVGQAIGPDAFTADDGTLYNEVIRAKVPELVRERLRDAGGVLREAVGVKGDGR